MTFFDYRSFYRELDRKLPPRGPDVSPQLRWYPVVTFFQLTLDMLMATTAPIGSGHVYAPAHYIDARIEVTDVRDWSPEEITRLEAAPLQAVKRTRWIKAARAAEDQSRRGAHGAWPQ